MKACFIIETSYCKDQLAQESGIIHDSIKLKSNFFKRKYFYWKVV